MIKPCGLGSRIQDVENIDEIHQQQISLIFFKLRTNTVWDLAAFTSIEANKREKVDSVSSWNISCTFVLNGVDIRVLEVSRLRRSNVCYKSLYLGLFRYSDTEY